MDPLLIPGYKIESTIGQGGMATVYLAIQERLDRKVAIKVMSPSLAADPLFCERFIKEGKIIAQLTHPHIVTIYDIACYESHYYMAVEYIGGATLKQRIQRGFGLEQPLSVLSQIASALGFAHEHDFIHRDVKPANILFREDGSAVLTDFGIAKALSSNTQLTMVGYTVGTPEYMSPEQAIGQATDARSDLYSLGIVLYEMLMGQKPFVGDDAFATALMHVNNPVPTLPEEYAPFQALIDRLLAKDPSERFASAEELMEFIDHTAKALEKMPTRPMMSATRPMSSVTDASLASREAKPAGSSVLWRWGVGVTLSIAVLFGAAYVYSTRVDTVGGGVEELQIEPPIPPISKPGPVDPAKQEKIKRMLEIAQAHVVVGRLTEPPGSNAYEAYKQVLELEPDNAEAKQGLQEIEKKLQEQE